MPGKIGLVAHPSIPVEALAAAYFFAVFFLRSELEAELH